MAPPSKIVDEAEAKRWLIDEKRTYQWCVDEYLRKYNIPTTISMWSKLQLKWGEPRNLFDVNLIPWRIDKQEHRIGTVPTMLRTVARARAGRATPGDMKRAEDFVQQLNEMGAVIHYAPNTEQGWFYVPREPGDKDIIRQPKAAAKVRRKT